MPWLAWLPGDQSGPAAAGDSWYQRSGAVATVAGVTVTPDTALSVSTVYACTSVISETLAAAPLHMHEIRSDGSHGEAPNHPLEELLHDQPNDYQTALEFREMMTALALLRGRGVAEIVPGKRGAVDQIKPLHPDLVRPVQLPGGKVAYDYQDPLKGNQVRRLLDDEVFVLRGRFGIGVVQLAAQTIGISLALDAYAANLFARGARPSGVLAHPRQMPDNVRQALRKALDEMAVGGPRNGRPLMLEDGMTWTQMGMTSQEAEFLGFRQFTVAEISGRWFRVPPHKVGELTRSTNNNIEQQSIDFQTDTLLPWAERWEQAIRRDLIIAKGKFFAEHNLDGVARALLQERYEAYGLAIQWGWMSKNDVRRKENMDPIPGGDEYLTPLNMTAGGAQTRAVENRLRLLVRDGAARAVRKESAAVGKILARAASEPDGAERAIAEFYREHAGFVRALLRVSRDEAEAYASQAAARVLASGSLDDELDRIDVLTHLAHDRSLAIHEFTEPTEESPAWLMPAAA